MYPGSWGNVARGAFLLAAIKRKYIIERMVTTDDESYYK